MPRLTINNPWLRILQHVLFWALSFSIFLNIFKLGHKPEKIDYVYTALFHIFIVPTVYINLLILIPWLQKKNHWAAYFISIFFLILIFSWINFSFFSSWSNKILPDYFFISYFSFLQVTLFFIVYISITALLKLSKSWFVVNKMQKDLLSAEKIRSDQKRDLLELEAKALRAQMNPHFILIVLIQLNH